MSYQAVELSASAEISQHNIKTEISTVRYLSAHAELFYKTGTKNVRDHQLKEVFGVLKNLHGDVKNLLKDSPFNSSPTVPDMEIKHRPVALISESPPSSLINTLIECEKSQKNQQLQIIQSLCGFRLGLALSAQTAKLQIAIDQLKNIATTQTAYMRQ
ncbi:hypothetical protein [uncultured Microbulbifer sp.]|uniref:hypothetical protein n=1 Tax=uncultured Microbulbifer sp. TaxID=348147 RepID=UPI0026099AE9|nr:hypothetical protein [uncultured Microbulbifer sp.]